MKRISRSLSLISSFLLKCLVFMTFNYLFA
uniref:Uncharacterized protein n=1 Tax=Siphoviridae sp. ctxc31 TaxID=2826520 RepID=A0A8S5MM83_9CAUD|nr:MAG TPA: hypothetical protein [Siphoviridae sp. ctxc31]